MNLKMLSSNSRQRYLIIAVLIVLLVSGSWYWVEGRSPETTSTGSEKQQPGNGAKGFRASPPPAPVVVETASLQDMDVIINALGTVTPTATVTVRSRVDGPLLSVHFKEGQMVREGELLAEIDPKPFEAALTQAIGQRKHDEALLENARLDLQRYQTLLAQDSISKQQVDTQHALVKQYEGTVQADQGIEDNARLQLGYTRITAPVSGRIGLRQVDPGNMIHASDTNGLVIITAISPINVIYTIPEDSLPAVMKKLNAAESLSVTVWDRQLRNKLAEGVVQALDNQIDPLTGTVKLKALFDNKDRGLFPSQFVNVRMLLDKLSQVTTVPLAAIQRGQRGTFVYEVLDDKTVKVRTVVLGPNNGEWVVITEGLQPDQRVVVDGADNLREGMHVESVTAADRAAVTTPASQSKHNKGNAPAEGTVPAQTNRPAQAHSPNSSTQAAPSRRLE